MELLHSMQAAGVSFEVAVLLATAGTYALFELMLMATAAKRRAKAPIGDEAVQLVAEAYRPVTSWTSRPE